LIELGKKLSHGVQILVLALDLTFALSLCEQNVAIVGVSLGHNLTNKALKGSSIIVADLRKELGNVFEHLVVEGIDVDLGKLFVLTFATVLAIKFCEVLTFTFTLVLTFGATLVVNLSKHVF